MIDTIDDDEVIFSTDVMTARFDTDADGIIETDDGTEFDWDEIDTVTIDDPPWIDAFETDQFHRIPATVAKPIPQQYRYGVDTLTLMKPREELKKSIWSLDNKPWTLGHPDGKLVRNVDDIHGFWDDSYYVDSLDEARSYLHMPVNDADGKEFIEENQDVSMGFTHRVASARMYDGVVGGADDDASVDGYQTDIYFDHVASVRKGRCSSEQGCGLDTINTMNVRSDAPDQMYDHDPFVDVHESQDGVIFYETYDGSFISETAITHDYRDEVGDSSKNSAKLSSSTDFEDEDGTYYAVAPDENPDGTPKYPITSCTGEDSVQSAWDLRHHGDIDISVETLEERIRRRASELDCDIELGSNEENDTMTDTETCTDCEGGLSLDFDDMSVEYVRESHDAVDELIDALESEVSEAEDEISDLEETVDEYEDRIEALESTVDKYESEAKAELIEKITSVTDHWDEDELTDLDLEELNDRRELAVDLAADPQSVGGDDGGSDLDLDSGPERITPWD